MTNKYIEVYNPVLDKTEKVFMLFNLNNRKND